MVAFGTTWMPNIDGITIVVEAIKQMPNTGFIVSLKEACDAYGVVKKANLPNIMLQKFVPQLELLHDPRVISFVSHGGGNSIVESMYYGKVLIGFPMAID